MVTVQNSSLPCHAGKEPLRWLEERSGHTFGIVVLILNVHSTFGHAFVRVLEAIRACTQSVGIDDDQQFCTVWHERRQQNAPSSALLMFVCLCLEAEQNSVTVTSLT